MNEIDFTLAPSDISLSRCYQMHDSSTSTAESATTAGDPLDDEQQRVKKLSLTKALNTASNRAVRRILLARSWPSAEALNLSLRTVLAKQQQQPETVSEADGVSDDATDDDDSAKCPVPRPILNILTNKRDEQQQPTMNVPVPRGSGSGRGGARSEEEWVAEQIAVFRQSYGVVAKYEMAEAYLECVLSLATSGVESPRALEVMEGIYKEPYRRVLSVIQSVGAVLEDVSVDGGEPITRRISSKLLDMDICLSMVDKIALAKERKEKEAAKTSETEKKEEYDVSIPYDSAALLSYEASDKSVTFKEFKLNYESEAVTLVIAKRNAREGKDTSSESETSIVEEKPKGANERGRKRRFMFWAREKKEDDKKGSDGEATASNEEETADVNDVNSAQTEEDKEAAAIKPEDLGGVLLSVFEPTMTRQLNVLSNIVQRTLTFGGDQELIVLAETLDADRPSFVKRWYPDSDSADSQPGVQYLNSLIRLLRDCHARGAIVELESSVPLPQSYANAYRRLTSLLVESGSGYVRPAGGRSVSLGPLPKSPKEELGRFAEWESDVRKRTVDTNAYPEDLVGSWNVEDLVGGSIIGSTTVSFRPDGDVTVAAPMQGLRWRLDPGPTHLDTVTFQVLSDDGAILQYKGFVDRGSRLEARISKRSVKVRGSVSFLMRDADTAGDGYWDDMLPVNLISGTSRFVMSKNIDGDDNNSSESSSSQAKKSVTVYVPVYGTKNKA